MNLPSLLPFALAVTAPLLAACDTPCARLVYVDLYGPDETTRTVIINALSCDQSQDDLWLEAGPDGGGPLQHVELPPVPANTCWQVGHLDAQWGVEFTKTDFGWSAPWLDYAVVLGAGEQAIDDMATVNLTRDDVTAPLRADAVGGWHEVASYGGDCGFAALP